MKRKVKQVIGFGVVVVISTFLLSWPAVLRLIIQSGLQQARKEGQHLSWSGLSTGMKSASLESLSVWIPGPKIKGVMSIPISIELQEVGVALSAAPLLMLRPSFAYKTSLYGGSIKGDAHISRSSSELSAQLENVEVGRHPQIAALGVRGGTISGRLDHMVLTPTGPTDGTFSFSVQELSLPAVGATKTLLRIDDLGAFNLDAAGSVTPQAIEVSTIKLASKFGKVSGQLTAQNHRSDSPKMIGELRVSLSEQGSQIFGAWLPLVPGAGLDAATKEFSVRVAPLPCTQARADGAFITLGSGCAKLSFSQG